MLFSIFENIVCHPCTLSILIAVEDNPINPIQNIKHNPQALGCSTHLTQLVFICQSRANLVHGTIKSSTRDY